MTMPFHPVLPQVPYLRKQKSKKNLKQLCSNKSYFGIYLRIKNRETAGKLC